MPRASALAVFAAATLAILLIPGPAVLYVVTRSVEHGRRVGLASVLLVAVGLRRLPSSPPADPPPGQGASGRSDPRRAFAQGVVVNVLNPKTALFFLAFLPQFLDPARGPLVVQVLLLGATFIVLAVVTPRHTGAPPSGRG